MGKYDKTIGVYCTTQGLGVTCADLCNCILGVYSVYIDD